MSSLPTLRRLCCDETGRPVPKYPCYKGRSNIKRALDMPVHGCYLPQTYSRTPKQLMLGPGVPKAAPVNALEESHWLTQTPRGELHQHKLQPRLLTPSKGCRRFAAKVCAATVLAISIVFTSEVTDVLLPAELQP